ncbi:MAG: flagellar biosynthetic protein FliQ [Phycisphaerales bacterium]
MINESAIDLVREVLVVTLVVSSPVLVAGVAVGLVISIIQSVTQIQEQTLSLVPKLIIMGVVLVLLMRWIVIRLVEFSTDVFDLTQVGM